MKLLCVVLVHVVFLISSAHASDSVLFRVIGVKNQVLYQKEVSNQVESLGHLTHNVLTLAVHQGRISQYKGYPEAVLSIANLGDVKEVSDDGMEMDAYGWCYFVDGREGQVKPDQYRFSGNEHTIDWVYSYAHINRDVWTKMCAPADHFPKEK